MTDGIDSQKLLVGILVTLCGVAEGIHAPDVLIGESLAVNLPLVDVHFKLVTLITANAREGALRIADNVATVKATAGRIGGINQLHRLKLLGITAIGGKGRYVGKVKGAIKYSEIALGTPCHDGKVGVGRTTHNTSLNIVTDKCTLVIGRSSLKNTQRFCIL